MVVASGVMSYRVSHMQAYVEKVLHRLYSWATIGVALNFLSGATPASERVKQFMYYDPAHVLELAFKLTPNVVLRHDYLPNDFTLYLYRH
jgi:hypothetical protein